MKLLTCRIGDREQVCVLSQDSAKVYPLQELGLQDATMNDLIRTFTPEKRRLLQEAAKHGHSGGLDYAQVGKCAPIPHPVGNVICLGENYMQHAEESYRFQKVDYHGEQPYAVYFDKKVLRALGDGEAIDGHLDFVSKLDYEVELAVVLGRDALHVREEDVDDYIFGYSVANDISARDVQYRHKQNFLGKSLDTFFAMGPVIGRPAIADEMFADVSCHREEGPYQSVFSLAVHPDFQRRGYGRQLLEALIRQARREGRRGVTLTCREHRIAYYESFGFQNQGLSASVHGGVAWYDMYLPLEDRAE